ncbi:hypothetical protein E2C01_080767 [Portunus trituberculatus]|uniref:Uncharacterized protein n=1 Tax=Portunus trituberculatus TaxID=210409 RepID=A0A5B7IN02_PORTR|nr:hypothetical protein [Portunus trituberculatus]
MSGRASNPEPEHEIPPLYRWRRTAKEEKCLKKAPLELQSDRTKQTLRRGEMLSPGRGAHTGMSEGSASCPSVALRNFPQLQLFRDVPFILVLTRLMNWCELSLDSGRRVVLVKKGHSERRYRVGRGSPRKRTLLINRA